MLVVLELAGSLETTGLRVKVEVGPEGQRSQQEAIGELPPNPSLAEALAQWRQQYDRLEIVTIVGGG